MDTPAYLVPGISQITQLSSTSESVIDLGHSAKEPLMRPGSELSYRLEPHDHVLLPVHCRTPLTSLYGAAGGVPGGGAAVGYQEGWYTGYPAEARLRLIS